MIKKSRTRLCSARIVYSKLFSVLLLAGEHGVSKNTEDECARDGGDGNLTKGEGETADTGDEDCSNNKQVAVVVKVNLLDHLETGNCDKAVKCDANAAHYAVGNGGKECCEGTLRLSINVIL